MRDLKFKSLRIKYYNDVINMHECIVVKKLKIC